MLPPIEFPDRTGHVILPTKSLVGTRVLQKVIGSELYICEHFAATDDHAAAQTFFITAAELEMQINPSVIQDIIHF